MDPRNGPLLPRWRRPGGTSSKVARAASRPRLEPQPSRRPRSSGGRRRRSPRPLRRESRTAPCEAAAGRITARGSSPGRRPRARRTRRRALTRPYDEGVLAGQGPAVPRSAARGRGRGGLAVPAGGGRTAAAILSAAAGLSAAGSLRRRPKRSTGHPRTPSGRNEAGDGRVVWIPDLHPRGPPNVRSCWAVDVDDSNLARAGS